MPVRRIIKNIRFFRPFCLKGNLLTDGPYPARKNNSLALKRQERQPSGNFRRLLWAVTPARRKPRIHYIIKKENLLQ